MVIGATPENDYEIMTVANEFYKEYKLKRVYYSGYIPIVTENKNLPMLGTQPPLIRENRLYQTDWLLRFYGFKLDEILNKDFTNLEMDVDPKLSWALRHPDFFPVDINKADYQSIIRIPGVGRQSAMKIIQARKFGKLHEYQVRKMGISFNRAQYFMICADTPFMLGSSSPISIKRQILKHSKSKYSSQVPANQLSLF